MNPENKKFLLEMINKFHVSVMTHDDAVTYYMILPDDRPLSICAETTIFDPENAIVHYTITVDDDTLEEAIVDVADKRIDPIAQDIINIMKACSTKIMMQEAHLSTNKYMSHFIPNKKTYS